MVRRGGDVGEHMTHKKDDRFLSPIARARGLGSAHEGVHHWMAERITGALLIPLVIWLVYSIVNLHGATYLEFTAWMQYPVNAVLMIVFLLTSFYHGAMGLQVVIEDYVATNAKKLLMIIGIKIAFAVLAVASVFSILKIAL